MGLGFGVPVAGGLGDGARELPLEASPVTHTKKSYPVSLSTNHARGGSFKSVWADSIGVRPGQPPDSFRLFSRRISMSIVEHHDVVGTGSTRVEQRVATSRFVFSPGQIIAAVLGLVMSVIGIMTAARAGIDGSLNVPIVHVAGLHQSAMLGLIELGLGLLLVLGASSYAARDLVVGIGVIMVIGGVVLGAGGSTILHDVGTVHDAGWTIMVGGIIAIVAGSLGRLVRTRRSITTV
jgi:hypothetical protein